MTNGSFSGNPQTEWLTGSGDDRNMELLQAFSYTDPDGRTWPAPKGSIINGASIPAALWSTVGSPYTGDYRRASVVHDVACDDPTVSRKDADKMFYFACLTGGCSLLQARLLYAGVRIGAWVPDIRLWSRSAMVPTVSRRIRTVDLEELSVPATGSLTEESIQATFREISADLLSQPANASFESIDAIVEGHLQAKSKQ